MVWKLPPRILSLPLLKYIPLSQNKVDWKDRNLMIIQSTQSTWFYGVSLYFCMSFSSSIFSPPFGLIHLSSHTEHEKCKNISMLLYSSLLLMLCCHRHHPHCHLVFIGGTLRMAMQKPCAFVYIEISIFFLTPAPSFSTLSIPY